jgi:hypothetical protein
VRDFYYFGQVVGGNRALTDVVGVGDTALRLASIEALTGLFLLVRRKDRRAIDLTPLTLASARPRAVRSRIRRRSRGAHSPISCSTSCPASASLIERSRRSALAGSRRR